MRRGSIHLEELSPTDRRVPRWLFTMPPGPFETPTHLLGPALKRLVRLVQAGLPHRRAVNEAEARERAWNGGGQSQARPSSLGDLACRLARVLDQIEAHRPAVAATEQDARGLVLPQAGPLHQEAHYRLVVGAGPGDDQLPLEFELLEVVVEHVPMDAQTVADLVLENSSTDRERYGPRDISTPGTVTNPPLKVS